MGDSAARRNPTHCIHTNSRSKYRPRRMIMTVITGHASI
ncbi:hypothetical protein LI99_24210 [Mycolicibacterium smegmatis]|uniref:Uncharacterized protein n=1 Tax=Mycolicibacterium smegmatis (strain ATCC 700084 / mc(2)155) TaxID=246196 RepID=A0R1W3_MYCS2|nr:hypothetical protein MSMEG_4895 [Mycolicibacterium smegmatis MC2 155]AIU16565.1 hypothetical protein LI99_24210 [Mycolicibacterium smegmatis]AIU09940.1 hypothetical protein LJ00_24205 [Mycolicibacterium smegmatis MC2 155]AIU23188.1 hypothetical protein LI98_24215 [Mycolicibacterium smegmatis]TBH33652.1 hypothetical protein EYS45_21465 [Mycolicibacterium smegmatis MC2 155]